MREIDNSGSEIFPMNEEVKGGKNHKKIVAGSLLAPVFAVAAAGLITLAAVAETGENGPGNVWDSLPPPPYEENLPPEEPLIPPEEPEKKPEEPEKKPEEPEKKPEEPEGDPTTPPPTTPPPTTPPPTTPPPTTPPPTTPPPTTPPPFVPIYDPDPEPVVKPFEAPSLSVTGRYYTPNPLYVSASYEIEMGSAEAAKLTGRVTVNDTELSGGSWVPNQTQAFTGSGLHEGSIEYYGGIELSSDYVVKLILTLEWEENGASKSKSVIVPLGP